MRKYGYGVDLGGTAIKFGFFSDEGTLLEKWEIPTDRSENGANALPQIASTIKAHIDKTSADIIGVGIAVPGPVAPDGTVINCANLGWQNVPAGKQLSEVLSLPVKCLNDANAAAMGEAWMGSAKSFSSSVFITLGTGVGGGVILNGALLSGAHGSAGEIGHFTVQPDGVLCGCGRRGCFEQYASATALVRMAYETLTTDSRPSSLRGIAAITAKDVWDAAKSADALAAEITDRYCEYIARGAADIAAMFDPDVIIIGGGVSAAGAPLIESVSKKFRKHAFTGVKDAKILPASLGNDAGIYGSMHCLLN